MERYTNFFELHVGFPKESSGEVASDEFLLKLHGLDSPEWTRSTVQSVHLTDPGCLDPHNVPGTLGWLVSRKVFLVNQSWKDTIKRFVLPACDRALQQLSTQSVEDARLEIEFPFACFASSVVDGKLARTAWAEDPVTIDASQLTFTSAIRLPDVPQWEIHLLFEKVQAGKTEPLAVSQVAAFLQSYGINTEQTIEYRSHGMEEEGRTDCRLIATAYYPNAEETQKQAERIFYQTRLCEDALKRGYAIRLILEHIITCLRPEASKTSDLIASNPTKVTCAG